MTRPKTIAFMALAIGFTAAGVSSMLDLGPPVIGAAEADTLQQPASRP